jgi:hypothetical protein
MSGILSLPPEVFLGILQYLKADRKTDPVATALFRLGLTCHSIHKFMNLWATSEAIQDLQNLHSVCSKGNTCTPSPLSVLCRRLGNVCMLCSNRARRSSTGEIFTNLPLCRACEATKVPKISNINLERLYALSGDPQDFLKTLESRENLDHRLYRWSDIEPLVVNGSLKEKWKSGRRHRNDFIPFNPEEYAEFSFEQLDYDEEEEWMEMIWKFPQLLLKETLEYWTASPFDKYSPILIEAALFNEFHYRFDYSWEPKPTQQDRVSEYASVARHWTEGDMWHKRPWRLSEFPETPRCSVSNPYAQQCHKRMDQARFSDHQRQCNLRRALIRAYPATLSNPDVWSRCVRMSDFDESICLARSARLTNRPARHRNLDFELLTKKSAHDVLMTRASPKLKPVFYERYFERKDITMRKVAIVSIRKGSVEIKLPGPDARVKFREIS